MAKAGVVNVVKPMEVDLNLPVERALPGVSDDTDSDERTDLSPRGAKPPPGEKQSPTDDELVNGFRKRHRRKNKAGHHHNKKKWKPYNKLSWDEKQKLDEKESANAQRKRDKQFAQGQPMAPYNTTQYVMEQHEPTESQLDLDENPPRRNKSGEGGSGSVESSDEYFYDSPDNEEIFLEKEFAEAYETCHAERLQSMTKSELVNDYLLLESKVEKLEKLIRNGNDTAADKPAQNNTEGTSPSAARGDNLKRSATKEQLLAEMARLKSENSRLFSENARLQSPTAKEK